MIIFVLTGFVGIKESDFLINQRTEQVMSDTTIYTCLRVREETSTETSKDSTAHAKSGHNKYLFMKFGIGSSFSKNSSNNFACIVRGENTS